MGLLLSSNMLKKEGANKEVRGKSRVGLHDWAAVGKEGRAKVTQMADW